MSRLLMRERNGPLPAINHGAWRRNSVHSAIRDVDANNFKVRIGAERCGLSVSDFSFLCNARAALQGMHGERLLSLAEEREVLLLMRKKTGNVVLQPRELLHVFTCFVSKASLSKRLPSNWKDIVRSREFCTSFAIRHRDSTIFVEGEEHRCCVSACNADTLTMFFAKVERSMHEYLIDPRHLVCLTRLSFPIVDEPHSREWNLSQPECPNSSVFPVVTTDYSPITCLKIMCSAYGTGLQGSEVILAECAYSKEEEAKDFCSVMCEDSIVVEGQRSPLVPSRREIGLWVGMFLVQIAKLTKRRAVLLLYDSQSVRFTENEILLLTASNVILFPLPQHTNSRTNPLLKNLHTRLHFNFKNFAESWNRGEELSTGTGRSNVIDALLRSYRLSTSKIHWECSFRCSGLCPLDEVRAFNSSLLLSPTRNTEVATLSDLCDMVDARRRLPTNMLFPSNSSGGDGARFPVRSQDMLYFPVPADYLHYA